MNAIEKMVLQALKDKAPSLHQELNEARTLRQFVTERADEIREAVHNRGWEIALAQGYNQLLQTDPMKASGVMNMALALAREEVFAELLEFPPETTDEDEFPNGPDGEYLRLLAATSR